MYLLQLKPLLSKYISGGEDQHNIIDIHNNVIWD